MTSRIPSNVEIALLFVVGAMAGAIGALQEYRKGGPRQSFIIGALEGLTAVFATVVSFLCLWSFLPVFIDRDVHNLGLIGLSGAIAHMGLRKTIRYLLARFANGNVTKEKL